jgi:hypothetical protein
LNWLSFLFLFFSLLHGNQRHTTSDIASTSSSSTSTSPSHALWLQEIATTQKGQSSSRKTTTNRSHQHHHHPSARLTHHRERDNHKDAMTTTLPCTAGGGVSSNGGPPPPASAPAPASAGGGAGGAHNANHPGRRPTTLATVASLASLRDQFDARVPADLTLSIVVIGASGDLAKKKTYPALFALFSKGCVLFLISSFRPLARPLARSLARRRLSLTNTGKKNAPQKTQTLTKTTASSRAPCRSSATPAPP